MTYPTIMPALTLDFQNSKQLDPRVTFSRSSGATYINDAGLVVSADEHEPRFDHDSNGESLGLLIEESRTNLILNTSTPDASNWDVLSGGATPVSSTSTAPDGSTGCIRIQSSVQNGGGKRIFTPPAAGTYICSVYARSRTGVAQNVYCTLSTVGSSITATLPADGSWVRVVSDATVVPAVSGKTFGIRANDSSGCDIDVWGEQAELGAFPSSYIPTAGSAITRSADIAQMTGDNFSSWYNQSEGAVFIKADKLSNDSEYPVVIDDGTGSNRHLTNLSNAYQYQIRTAGATQAQIAAGTLSGFSESLAFAYKANDAAVALNGSSNSDNTVIVPTCNRMQIFAFSGSTSNGHISRLTYYNERLTDAELQTLTL